MMCPFTYNAGICLTRKRPSRVSGHWLEDMLNPVSKGELLYLPRYRQHDKSLYVCFGWRYSDLGETSTQTDEIST